MTGELQCNLMVKLAVVEVTSPSERVVFGSGLGWSANFVGGKSCTAVITLPKKYGGHQSGWEENHAKDAKNVKERSWWLRSHMAVKFTKLWISSSFQSRLWRTEFWLLALILFHASSCEKWTLLDATFMNILILVAHDPVMADASG